MTQYKLNYFDVRGIAEPIRFILAIEGVSFEDKRISWEEWNVDGGNLKSELGYGQLPVLEIDGKQLTQSMAIMRYLAKIYNYIPDDIFLAARCDEVGDIVTELRLEFRQLIMAKEEEKKAELKINLNENIFPKYYKLLNNLVNETKGSFIAGDKISWADLVLANMLEIWEELVVPPEFLNSYLGLKILREKVFTLPALSEYLAKRPKTWI